MAVVSSPFGPKPQFELSSGAPAVGNLLFAYVAGSVGTKQNTFTDSTGNTPNTNPLVLNSLGMVATEWWWTEGLTYKIVYAPAGDTDPPTSPIWTIDNLVGINPTQTAGTEWVSFTGAPTFISTTSFSVVGDQTSTFQVGRRIRTTNTAGTIYSLITASVFGAVTTITVINDSGVLDSGLSAVSYGFLSATNESIPVLRGVKALTTFGVGNATPSSSGSGVSFPATQSASTDANTLDDYEEGTWTPVLTFTTPGNLSVVYSAQAGSYTKIGRQVTATFTIVTSTFTHTTASGTCQITGVPFTSKTLTNYIAIGSGYWQGVTKANYTDVIAFIPSNAAYFEIRASGSGQVISGVAAADMPTTGSVQLVFTITYDAA